ncbi:PEP-CTERM sorting domain-containing protein [Aulosira sp. FACHB-615]|uniref:PEP-CTERM sorting domain-containing protein n=1 Tax=Aulosira sp. FACHB-615 TaxID=2692777 RepID=UPI0016849D4E|nr:PEP-CTERM sorting domain-containing protein [Aulosira sp. FACHB-615]MBD2486756.1 PEP-CTERM sorting domain-containing protein [Aulosira sp. FACHB-615]
MAKSNFFSTFSKLGLTLTTITAIGMATSHTANAATLLSDNFNSENGGVGSLNYNAFTNWNVSGGSVDLIGNGSFDLFPGNGLYLDTDGSTSNAGRITSKTAFTFNPGDLVDISFDLGGASRRGETNSVIVSLGSLFNETFTLPANEALTTIRRRINVATLTTANLAFEGVGGDNVGLILDNITLSRTPTSIPEPSAWLGVLALGALGTVSVSKRQLQKLKAKA